jgi:hypothetical protein
MRDAQPVARPFPTLSLFAIYSSKPLLDPSEKHEDAALEASKILYLHTTGPAVTTERKARVMGTVLGMADFASYVPTELGDM